MMAAYTKRPAEAGKSSAPSTPAQQARMLIVDDDPLVVSALSRMLPSSYDAVFAFSGGEAMQLLREDDDFDVIISDLIMPGQSGMELHAWLERARPFLAGRVIFITGNARTQAARRFLERVPNEHLDKPWDPRALLALIAMVARLRGLRGAAHEPTHQERR
jgi:two-component system, NtrC family, sensor kinase